MIYYYDPMVMKWFLKDIDAKAFEWPWCNWDNLHKYTVKVSMQEKAIRGFSIFKSVSNSILILRLATHHYCRNEGVGSELLNDIEATAKRQRLKLICVTVHECNDIGIKFLVSRGLVAGKVNRAFYPDGRDIYYFHKVIK